MWKGEQEGDDEPHVASDYKLLAALRWAFPWRISPPDRWERNIIGCSVWNAAGRFLHKKSCSLLVEGCARKTAMKVAL